MELDSKFPIPLLVSQWVRIIRPREAIASVKMRQKSRRRQKPRRIKNQEGDKNQGEKNQWGDKINKETKTKKKK